MWFRNLQLYCLTQPFDLDDEALDAQLQTRRSRECGGLEASTLGWEKPLGRHGVMLTHGVAQYVMICAKRYDRVLPTAVLQENLENRVAIIEEEENREVRRKERREIKDALMVELLPKAFSKSSLTYAYIDRRGSWLVVDAATPKRAEALITLLRETLGSLPLKPIEVMQSPADTMTGWLKNRRLPGFLNLGDECELRDTVDGGGIVRCRGQDLEGEEIGSHLKAGKQAVKLSLEWQQRIDFLVTAELAVKRLKFKEIVQEEAAGDEISDYAARFDGDFALMTGELSRFISSLVGCFGGLSEET
ncbi:MAG: recombination-associated protein RdgC [Gammaproteobacteria bacterium]|nr:recombination-associated protein RdgC [Gammaproteobacteria bacterium]